MLLLRVGNYAEDVIDLGIGGFEDERRSLENLVVGKHYFSHRFLFPNSNSSLGFNGIQRPSIIRYLLCYHELDVPVDVVSPVPYVDRSINSDLQADSYLKY
ncbi:hypothetical protein [Roseivirga pacifica]